MERVCSSESLSSLLRSEQNNNNRKLKMGGEEGKRDGDGEKKKREKGGGKRKYVIENETHMMVVLPAPLVPSRAVIWSLRKVRVSSWTAILWPSYSFVTDIRATPGVPPSSSPGPFCCESPVRRTDIHHEKIAGAWETTPALSNHLFLWNRILAPGGRPSTSADFITENREHNV